MKTILEGRADPSGTVGLLHRTKKELKKFRKSISRRRKRKVEKGTAESENLLRVNGVRCGRTSNEENEIAKNCSKENIMPPVIRDPPSDSMYSDLATMLGQYNRRMDFINGDGNCFFRAISKELYGIEERYNSVRQEIVNFMEHNSRMFCLLRKRKNPIYFINMRKDKVWATTAEVFAAATLFSEIIYLFTPVIGGKYLWYTFPPLLGGESSDSFITLCHTDGRHFDRIVPVNQVNNRNASPPPSQGNFLKYYLGSKQL